MFRKAILVLLALPLLTAWAAEAPTPPLLMELSSWQSDVSGGAIAGGTQTVTVISTSDVVQPDVVFDVAPPPCECELTANASTQGSLDGDVWSIGELGPGDTAELVLVYG